MESVDDRKMVHCKFVKSKFTALSKVELVAKICEQ